MSIFLFILCLVVFVFYLTFGLELILGNRTIKFLKDIPRYQSINPPKVSIVIAARNEESTIEAALQSVLLQDYENFEVLVVNDRSTDLTGMVLAKMATDFNNLRVLTIKELPNRWLGKNYALYSGSRQTNGKLLLFSDADVVMKPDAVSKAVNYLLTERLDHVTCLPDQATRSFPLRVFITAFGFFFSLYSRPWRAHHPNRWHIGIGAFQLIRSEFYVSIGGHMPIAMRPDDDMQLGKLIKLHKGRQHLVWGKNEISVVWYNSIKELISGLMKNAFAGVNYSLFLVFASTLALFTFCVFPFIAVFITSGYAFWMSLASLMMIAVIFWDSAKYLGLNRWYALGFPLATILLIYIMWKAALRTIGRGGIEWRGTFYPLKDLKANKI